MRNTGPVCACATPPPPAPEPEPVVLPTPDPGPVVARDDDFAIVTARAGDTLATLAQRYLGDASRAWWIAQFNNVTSARAGQIVVVPLRIRNPRGVYANGYQTIPILCYHRFGARAAKLNVSPASFEAQ